MDDDDFLAKRFEEYRPHLRAVAYRMLGSLTEADDAVQEAWLRLSRSDADEVLNLGGWLTTVVARVCLNMLRTRATRREDPMPLHIPDPIVSPLEGGGGPEDEAVLADSVGLALLVVLEQLPPAERVAFVLHDTFAVPFDEIGAILGRTPTAARQLASRARRRVRGAAPRPDADLARQREVVNAFFAAARAGNFDALIAVLDPDIVVRSDFGAADRGPVVVRGAHAVASQALHFADPRGQIRPVLVNGTAGVVVTLHGEPVAVMGFTIAGGRVVAVDGISDRQRIAKLDLAFLDE